MVLAQLADSRSNKCVARCVRSKVAFIVDSRATKPEIAGAVEKVYAEKNITVKKVNTVTVRPKKRKVRGRQGFRSGFKKAIVTLDEGDVIDEKV